MVPCLGWPSAQEVRQPTRNNLSNRTLVTDENASPLPSLGIHLGRTKTSGADHDEIVYLTGRPVDALTPWLEVAKSRQGQRVLQSGSLGLPHGQWSPAPTPAWRKAGTISAIDRRHAEWLSHHRARVAGKSPLGEALAYIDTGVGSASF